MTTKPLTKRNLQLCTRCGRYCRRTLNLCPFCCNGSPRWRQLARHNGTWYSQAKITESVLERETDTAETPTVRRFTATIAGFRGFKLYEGPIVDGMIETVRRRARAIHSRMDRGDEMVFHEKDAAERSELIARIYADARLQPLPKGMRRHLIGLGGNLEGFFLVGNRQLRLDREAFRGIVAEARQYGIGAPYFIYGRTCTYSGPNIEFMQIGG